MQLLKAAAQEEPESSLQPLRSSFFTPPRQPLRLHGFQAPLAGNPDWGSQLNPGLSLLEKTELISLFSK